MQIIAGLQRQHVSAATDVEGAAALGLALAREWLEVGSTPPAQATATGPPRPPDDLEATYMRSLE
jgi:hypothetical protein